MNVTIWNEYRHERKDKTAAEHYPKGIHQTIAAFLKDAGMVTTTAILDEPEHGLTDEILAATDVLVWWGHKAHDEVTDKTAEKVKAHVLDGMGLVVLHSAHFSKPFKKLMGTTCNLKWREEDEKERLWVVDPTHPITEGLDEYIELEKEETYGEHFDIPVPDELIFISWFSGGEVFRSGATFKRGRGKIFYFRPGDETYPTYYHPDIQQVIKNGVKWAANTNSPNPVRGNSQSLEKGFSE